MGHFTLTKYYYVFLKKEWEPLGQMILKVQLSSEIGLLPLYEINIF